MDQTTTNAALRRALDHFGSREALAAECRVTTDTVRNWERRGRVSGAAARLIAELMNSPRMESKLK